MGKMTESEMFSEISARERMISDCRRKIRNVEASLDELDQIRARITKLLQQLEEDRSHRLHALENACSNISVFRFGAGPLRFAHRYQSEMRDMFAGPMFSKTYSGIETAKSNTAKTIQDLIEALNGLEREIANHEEAINWLRAGIQRTREYEAARLAAEAEEKRQEAERAAKIAAGEPVAELAVVRQPISEAHAAMAYTWEAYRSKFGFFPFFEIRAIPFRDLVMRIMG